MRRFLPRSSTFVTICSVVLVSAGVAGNDGLEPTLRTIPAMLAICAGLACLATTVGEYSASRLRDAARRWWLAALAAFFPYAVATSPSSPSATSVAESLHDTGVVPALGAVAGGIVLCAVTTTVVYGFAAHGLHPGAPTPEERVLEDQHGD